MNKFQHVSSFAHQLSLAGGGGSAGQSNVGGGRTGGSNAGGGSMCTKVQCIMGNGHIGVPLCGQNDWLTYRHYCKYYLSTTSLVG